MRSTRAVGEPGGSGNEEAFPTEIPLNGHQKCLPPPEDSVYHLVSGQLVDQGPDPGCRSGSFASRGYEATSLDAVGKGLELTSSPSSTGSPPRTPFWRP